MANADKKTRTQCGEQRPVSDSQAYLEVTGC